MVRQKYMCIVPHIKCAKECATDVQHSLNLLYPDEPFCLDWQLSLQGLREHTL